MHPVHIPNIYLYDAFNKSEPRAFILQNREVSKFSGKNVGNVQKFNYIMDLMYRLIGLLLVTANASIGF
jgi:hypothetical protein